jgi:hypothetical protein
LINDKNYEQTNIDQDKNLVRELSNDMQFEANYVSSDNDFDDEDED